MTLLGTAVVAVIASIMSFWGGQEKGYKEGFKNGLTAGRLECEKEMDKNASETVKEDE